MAAGIHPFPSRTRQLSPPAPMVLGGRLPGRVGRRRNTSRNPQHVVLGVFCSPVLFFLIPLVAASSIAALRGGTGGQPSRTSSFFIWLRRRAILTIAALKLPRGALQARVHLDEIPLGRLFREVEHLPATDLAATSVTPHDEARRGLISAASDHVPAPLATQRPDVVKGHPPSGVGTQMA
jgi:hypothetical protein